MSKRIDPYRFSSAVLNSIDAWFAAGGLGNYYFVDPFYCFTDTAGSVNAAVGDAVARLNDRSGSPFYVGNATLAQRPILQFDATKGRYYLAFSAASVQRLSADLSSAFSDWRYLSNGNEYVSVALAQFGNTSNPNALYALWATQHGSSLQLGATHFFDDRSSASHNNAQRMQISRGTGTIPIDLAVDNVITPNTPVVVSQGYHYNIAGNDATMRVNGSPTGGSDSASAPLTADPDGRLTIGAFDNATAALDGRIYALALLSGSGAIASIAAFEADI